MINTTKRRNHHFDSVSQHRNHRSNKKVLTFSLVLESGGTYDMSDEKFLDNMKQEIRTKMQSLALPTPKVASEFYTAAEMVSKEIVNEN